MSNEVKPTKLDRFGIKWQGARKPICTPADDGYWTPWHVAQERIRKLEAALAKISHLLNEEDRYSRSTIKHFAKKALEPPR